MSALPQQKYLEPRYKKEDIGAQHFNYDPKKFIKDFKIGIVPDASVVSENDQKIEDDKHDEMASQNKEPTKKGTKYMVDYRGKFHRMPTDFEIAAANDERVKGNVISFNDWIKKKNGLNYDPSEQSQIAPIYKGWFKENKERLAPSHNTIPNRAYAEPKIESVSSERPINYGIQAEGDTPLKDNYARDIQVDQNVDFNEMGRMVSRAIAVPKSFYMDAAIARLKPANDETPVKPANDETVHRPNESLEHKVAQAGKGPIGGTVNIGEHIAAIVAGTKRLLHH